MKKDINYPAITVFYLIAISIRYLTTKTDYFAGIDNPYLNMALRGCGPTLGALVACKWFNLKICLSFKGIYRQVWIPFLVFWLFPILFISGIALLKNGEFPFLMVGMVLVYGLLEEIGWRGFLREQLKSLPAFASISIVAVLWFIWHVNIDWMTNLPFFFILWLGSWGIGKVADLTKSLFAVASFHSLNNFFPGPLDETKIGVLIFLLVSWLGGILLARRFLKVSILEKP